MEKKQVLEALQKLTKDAKERKFAQSVDLIVNLKNIDMKKADQQVDFYALLHHTVGKKLSVCALIGGELASEAKNTCDESIGEREFDTYAKDKKASKKLAAKHQWFIAQADIMPKVAQAFGRVLGSRGKMPNPKAGCIVPPKTSLKPLYDKLQKTVRIKTKNQPVLHMKVGTIGQKEDEIADNIMTVYDQIIHHLPQEENNIRSVFLKLTMSKPVKL